MINEGGSFFQVKNDFQQIFKQLAEVFVARLEKLQASDATQNSNCHRSPAPSSFYSSFSHC